MPRARTIDGTVETLMDGRLHGYAMAVRLQQLSNDILRVEEGPQLAAETESWHRLTGAVAGVLDA